MDGWREGGSIMQLIECYFEIATDGFVLRLVIECIVMTDWEVFIQKLGTQNQTSVVPPKWEPRYKAHDPPRPLPDQWDHLPPPRPHQTGSRPADGATVSCLAFRAHLAIEPAVHVATAAIERPRGTALPITTAPRLPIVLEPYRLAVVGSNLHLKHIRKLAVDAVKDASSGVHFRNATY